MKNRIKRYQKIEKNVASKEEQRQSMSRDLARADDDGFAIAQQESILGVKRNKLFLLGC